MLLRYVSAQLQTYSWFFRWVSDALSCEDGCLRRGHLVTTLGLCFLLDARSFEGLSFVSVRARRSCEEEVCFCVVSGRVGFGGRLLGPIDGSAVVVDPWLCVSFWVIEGSLLTHMVWQ
jgi:hypothetical protein